MATPNVPASLAARGRSFIDMPPMPTRRSRLERARLVLLAVWGLATPLPLLAAPTTSVPETPPIVGTVRDSSGIALPNVTVIVTGINRSATTNGQGAFVFRGLPAGRHHLTTLFLGFAPGHADVVVPANGDTVRVAIVLHATVLQLGGVQVTATPVGTDPRSVTQSTTDLAGQALARAVGPTIAQTLEGEPGVAMRFNGPAANAPVIRGLQGERILILQDGDRAGDLSGSAPDHGVSIDPLTAQRIEVVRGPASLLYGNSALGGVVNVISNEIPSVIPSHRDGYVASTLESVTPGGALSAGVSIPLSATTAFVARGGARRAEDLRMGGGLTLDNSYARNAYGSAGLAVAGSRGNGGVITRTYGFNYGLPSADGEGAHIEGRRSELVARAELGSPVNHIQGVRLNATAQWYGHDEVASSGSVNTSFTLHTQTADALARTQLGQVNGAFGASMLLKQYAAAGEEALVPAANSSGVGAFFFEEIPLRPSADPDALVPRLQLGGRFDSYHITSQDSDDPKFGPGIQRTFQQGSGSIGLSVPVGERLSFAMSGARAFRAPTVEELFSNAFHEAAGTFDRGNPALHEEVNTGVDGILRLHTRRVNGQVSVFASRISNYITPNIVSDTTIDGEDGPESVPLNRFSQGNARMRGLEGRLEMEVAPRVVVGAMGDMVRGTLTTTDEPLPYMPAARLGALARWDPGAWSLGAEMRHGFAQDRVPPAVSDEDPSGLATEAYTVVNLNASLSRTLGSHVHMLTLRVDNAGNAQYRDATSRIKTFAFNPGRNVSLVYRVLF